MRKSGRLTATFAVAVSLVISPLAAPVAAGDQQAIVTSRRIGPGAYYKKIVKPWKPWVIHVVTVKLERRSTIDVGLAGNELGYVEHLASIASRKEAIAAINGDFGSRERRPWNTYAEDGEFVKTEHSWGRALSVNAPENSWFLGHPRARIRLVPKGAKRINIDRVNTGKPHTEEIALFTGSGKDIQDTPTGTCSARLTRVSERKINKFGSASQTFEVAAMRCAKRPLPIYKGIVVSARRQGERKAAIKALAVGQKARLTWNLADMEKSLDVIGGNPMIVENGKILWSVVKDCGYLCRIHPRSAVGVTKKNKLIMVVVDGRSEKSRGMYLNELAKWFVAQHADRAMTFDGGGAAQMWVQGEIVNEPSDGDADPRAVVNALLLLKGADAGDPEPVTAGSTSVFSSPEVAYGPLSAEAARETYELSAADGGSLGGLADFLSRRGADIPPWMERVAEDLRANELGR